MKLLAPVNDVFDITSRQILRETLTFPSTLAIGIGTARLYFGRAATIVNVITGVGTAPTGASVIFDLNKNGTTTFTTQGNRPTIAISGFSDTSSIPDITAIAAGDYLTADIDQVGSTVAGSDAVLIVEYYHTTA